MNAARLGQASAGMRPEGTNLSPGRVLAATALDKYNITLLVSFDDTGETMKGRMPLDLWHICRTYVLQPNHRVRISWYTTKEYDDLVVYITSITPLS